VRDKQTALVKPNIHDSFKRNSKTPTNTYRQEKATQRLKTPFKYAKSEKLRKRLVLRWSVRRHIFGRRGEGNGERCQHDSEKIPRPLKKGVTTYAVYCTAVVSSSGVRCVGTPNTATSGSCFTKGVTCICATEVSLFWILCWTCAVGVRMIRSPSSLVRIPYICRPVCRWFRAHWTADRISEGLLPGAGRVTVAWLEGGGYVGGS